MAFTVTDRGGNTFVYASSATVSDSFPAATGDLIVCVVKIGSSYTPAASGFGETFEVITDIKTGTEHLYMLAAIIGSGQTDDVTLTGSNFVGVAATCQIVGADASGTAANAFLQAIEYTAVGPSSPTTISGGMSAFTSATNLAFTVGGIFVTGTFTNSTGYTLACSHTRTGQVAAYYDTDGDNTQTLTAGDYFNHRTVHGIACEIAEVSGAASIIPQIMQQHYRK